MEAARSEVRKALEKCQATDLRHVRELGGACVLVKSVEVAGKSGIWIRKGKRILSLEVSVAFEWEFRDEFGGPLGVKGSGKAVNITEDEDDGPPKVEVKVSASSSGGKEARAAGEWMRRRGAAALGAAVEGRLLGEAILAADAAQARPEADRARRAAEQHKAEEARRSSSEAQARIAAEQRVREAARGADAGPAAAGASSAADASNGGDAVAASAVAGASVWNANAWHWEERPMNDWAHAWLRRELAALRPALLGGAAEAEFLDVEVSGDASVSVRKGRHVVLFALDVACRWRATANATGIGEARGSLRIPDFTSEDGARSAIEVDPGIRAARGSTSAVVKSFHQEGVREVRALLTRFVSAIADKLPSEGGIRT